MAAGQLVPRQRLIDRIREVVARNETGILTIVTDTGRAVLLRFSSGRLTHCHARSSSVEDVIRILNECASVKFAFTQARVDRHVEPMATADFLRMLDPHGAGADLSGDLLPPVAQVMEGQLQSKAGPLAGNARLKDMLVQLAVEYVGPVAIMIVEEAENAQETFEQAVERIASMIPDREHAGQFREAVRRQTSSL